MNRVKSMPLLAGLAAAAMVAAVQPPAVGQSGGTIQGRVLLAAAPPANAVIRMGADPYCLQINGGKRIPQEVVLRDADGGLRNAFVNVQGSFPKAAPPSAPAVIDQKGCLYQPRVQGARVGQTLEVKNDDDTLHNIHSLTAKDNAFNMGQPKPGMVFKYVLKSEEVMLRVRCDVHPWMTGYVGVMAHPYYAVSGDKGAFTIADVPPGKYTVQAWHERYGTQTKSVEVKAGTTATVDFTYSGGEKASAAPGGFVLQDFALPAGVGAAELLAPAAAP